MDLSAAWLTTAWSSGSHAMPCTKSLWPSNFSLALPATFSGSQNMQVMSLDAVTKPDPSDAQHTSMTSSFEYALQQSMLDLVNQEFLYLMTTRYVTGLLGISRPKDWLGACNNTKVLLWAVSNKFRKLIVPIHRNRKLTSLLCHCKLVQLDNRFSDWLKIFLRGAIRGKS